MWQLNLQASDDDIRDVGAAIIGNRGEASKLWNASSSSLSESMCTPRMPAARARASSPADQPSTMRDTVSEKITGSWLTRAVVAR